MLPVAMIRKMTKMYSDARIRSKTGKILFDGGWWTNGFIALCETLPFDPEIDNVQESKLTDQAAEWDAQATRQVWPVEIAPLGDGSDHYSDGRRVVRFTDGNGINVWVDAGYVSAVLKREPMCQWYANPDKAKQHGPGGRATTAPIAARNGQPIALIMPMSFKELPTFADVEWRITNTDLSAAKDLETCQRLQALLPKRAGSKWHMVEYKGRKLEVRRTSKLTIKACLSDNKTTTRTREYYLHIRIANEEFAFSLYDGRKVAP